MQRVLNDVPLSEVLIPARYYSAVRRVAANGVDAQRRADTTEWTPVNDVNSSVDLDGACVRTGVIMQKETLLVRKNLRCRFFFVFFRVYAKEKQLEHCFHFWCVSLIDFVVKVLYEMFAKPNIHVKVLGSPPSFLILFADVIVSLNRWNMIYSSNMFFLLVCSLVLLCELIKGNKISLETSPMWFLLAHFTMQRFCVHEETRGSNFFGKEELHQSVFFFIHPSVTCNNKKNINNDKPVTTYYVAPNLTLKQQTVDFQPLNFSFTILHMLHWLIPERMAPHHRHSAPCWSDTGPYNLGFLPGSLSQEHTWFYRPLTPTSAASSARNELLISDVTINKSMSLLSQSPWYFLFLSVVFDTFSSSTTNMTD